MGTSILFGQWYGIAHIDFAYFIRLLRLPGTFEAVEATNAHSNTHTNKHKKMEIFTCNGFQMETLKPNELAIKCLFVCLRLDALMQCNLR